MCSPLSKYLLTNSGDFDDLEYAFQQASFEAHLPLPPKPADLNPLNYFIETVLSNPMCNLELRNFILEKWLKDNAKRKTIMKTVDDCSTLTTKVHEAQEQQISWIYSLKSIQDEIYYDPENTFHSVKFAYLLSPTTISRICSAKFLINEFSVNDKYSAKTLEIIIDGLVCSGDLHEVLEILLLVTTMHLKASTDEDGLVRIKSIEKSTPKLSTPLSKEILNILMERFPHFYTTESAIHPYLMAELVFIHPTMLQHKYTDSLTKDPSFDDESFYRWLCLLYFGKLNDEFKKHLLEIKDNSKNDQQLFFDRLGI